MDNLIDIPVKLAGCLIALTMILLAVFNSGGPPSAPSPRAVTPDQLAFEFVERARENEDARANPYLARTALRTMQRHTRRRTHAG